MHPSPDGYKRMAEALEPAIKAALALPPEKANPVKAVLFATPPVIDGKLENGRLTGSWNHDGVKGDFKISKKN